MPALEGRPGGVLERGGGLTGKVLADRRPDGPDDRLDHQGEAQADDDGDDLVLQQRAETEAVDGEESRPEDDAGGDPRPVVPHVVGGGDEVRYRAGRCTWPATSPADTATARTR